MSIFSYITCIAPACSEKCAPSKLLCEYHGRPENLTTEPGGVDAWFSPAPSIDKSVHRCRFVLVPTITQSIMHWSGYINIGMRAYRCECGKKHIVETGKVQS